MPGVGIIVLLMVFVGVLFALNFHFSGSNQNGETPVNYVKVATPSSQDLSTSVQVAAAMPTPGTPAEVSPKVPEHPVTPGTLPPENGMAAAKVEPTTPTESSSEPMPVVPMPPVDTLSPTETTSSQIGFKTPKNIALDGKTGFSAPPMVEVNAPKPVRPGKTVTAKNPEVGKEVAGTKKPAADKKPVVAKEPVVVKEAVVKKPVVVETASAKTESEDLLMAKIPKPGDTVTITTSEPVISTPDPVVKPSEPVVKTPEPVVKAPEPTVKTPEPVVKTPEPTVKTPEPTVKTPEPVVKTPEPTVKTPEPVVKTPEPTVKTPEPVVKTPEPTVKTPIATPVSTSNGTVFDIPSLRRHSRTLIGLRPMLQADGWKVTWTSHREGVTCQRESDTLTIIPGSRRASFNGKSVYAPTRAVLTKTGHLYVPVQFLNKILAGRLSIVGRENPDEVKVQLASKESETGVAIGVREFSGIASIKRHGQVLVSLRQVLEADGWKVSWRSIKEGVVCQKGDSALLIRAGRATFYLNDHVITRRPAPFLHKGRLFVAQGTFSRVLDGRVSLIGLDKDAGEVTLRLDS